MIAQLSPSARRGSPSTSTVGVRCAGYFAMYSSPVVSPQTSFSSKSSPAARMKIRTHRLFTLGLRMFSVYSAIVPPLVLAQGNNLESVDIDQAAVRDLKLRDH